MLLTDTPSILYQHKTDTAGQGSIKLRIMEPPVHIQVGLVLKCPLRSLSGRHGNHDKIDSKRRRQDSEHEKPSEFAPS